MIFIGLNHLHLSSFALSHMEHTRCKDSRLRMDTLKWAVMLNHTSPWSEQMWCISIGLLLHFCCGTCVGKFPHASYNYDSGQALLDYSSLLKLQLACMYRNALPSVVVLEMITLYFLYISSATLHCCIWPKASIICLTHACMHIRG